MKTLKTLLTATVFVSAAISANVQAYDAEAVSESPLSSLIYEDTSIIYSTTTQQSSSPQGILSYGDNHNNNIVWSTEFEQYVNPADFELDQIVDVNSVNRLMNEQPTAAGSMTSDGIFIFNELAGEYQLQ